MIILEIAALKIASLTSSADFQYRADDDKTTSNKFWWYKTRRVNRRAKYKGVDSCLRGNDNVVVPTTAKQKPWVKPRAKYNGVKMSNLELRIFTQYTLQLSIAAFRQDFTGFDMGENFFQKILFFF